MYFDISQLDGPRSYKLLTATVVPRPIAWVVSADAQGRTNAAPFSFFNFFSGFPPVICLGLGRRDGGDKDTLANLRARGEFVVNLVSEDLVEAMNTTAVNFPPGVDELAMAGLDRAPCTKVAVPRIAASPVALECRFVQALEVDTSGHIAIGHVLAMHIRDDAVLDAGRCHVDTAALRLVGRMQSPGGYVRTTDTFRLRQLGYEEWQQHHGPAPIATGD